MVQKKISKKIILEFYRDIARWQSMVEYASNELLFLDKLLHAKAFENEYTTQIKKTEMIGLKREINTTNHKITNLMAEIELSKNNVQAFLECDKASNIEFSFKNYKTLKHNFELFNTSYNKYKAKIFEHTGGVL